MDEMVVGVFVSLSFVSPSISVLPLFPFVSLSPSLSSIICLFEYSTVLQRIKR